MKHNIHFLLTAILIFAIPFSAFGQASTEPTDETALFTSVAPDALLLLDASGSMNWTAYGETMYVTTGHTCGSDVAYYPTSDPGHSQACTISSDTVPKYGDSTCSGPFFYSSRTGYTTDCSRLAIAKRAIFSVLDDNKSGTINNQDEGSLGIRFGYMRFANCSSNESGDYSAGCNKLVRGISSTSGTGTKYSVIFCGSNSSCTVTSTGSNSINSETASGGTPLAGALQEAKSYLDYHKSNDSAALCRQKAVILITDGSDTFSCSGNGYESQMDMYKRRRETVAQAKVLADAGYKVFVVGLGAGMPHWLKNTLNWAAYYGNTDNPVDANSGDRTAYNPSSYSSCQSASYITSHTTTDGSHYYASDATGAPVGDPAELTLSGYAFLASSPTELESALKSTINVMREAIYSFSQISVQSTRTADENYLYEGSFQPVNNDPFWLGHLRKFAINADGTVGSMVWDAGTELQAASADNRNILTPISQVLSEFKTGTTALTNDMLAVTSTTERNSVIGYIRGESAYNTDYWKLGDVFRSTPITIGTPSSFFYDMNDANNAFDTFRTNHVRTSANGKRIILAGANDGQMHAFSTSTGAEQWSIIPPNLLSKLKNIAHSDHPTALSHMYFVDGPVSVADVWLGTGTTYKAKSESDWKTLMVISEGRGGSSDVWSTSADCTTGLSATYASGSYYCGYFAVDVTNSLTPAYINHSGVRWGTISIANTFNPEYMGDPWSKMMIGKVLTTGEGETWVGVIGAGYNGADCSVGGGCDTRGKGLYVVRLKDGAVIWSYTRANNSDMNYSLPANPAIVDYDNDGFIDTVYVGDLGGSMWRFKFCTASEVKSTSGCSVSNWSGSKLFASSSGVIRPIFTSAAAARDANWNLWVYWATGDKTDPTACQCPGEALCRQGQRQDDHL